MYRPRITQGRLLAGLLAGWTGGVALGLPFYAILIGDAQALTGPLTPARFWILHMMISSTIGVLFSIFVAPRSIPRGIGTALVVVLLGVYPGGRVVLWLGAGVPFEFGPRVLVEVLAHAIYAVALGWTYVYVHRTEVKDAANAKQRKWRRWSRKERGAE